MPNIVVVDISKLGKEEGEDVAVNLKLDQNGSRKSTFDLSSKLQLTTSQAFKLRTLNNKYHPFSHDFSQSLYTYVVTDSILACEVK